MRLLPRRALVSLVLSLAFVVVAAVPAGAYNPSQRGTQRPRHGVTSWVPESAEFSHFNSVVSGEIVNYYTFAFTYDRPETQFEMDGSEQVLELNAQMPCDANGRNPFAFEDYGYDTSAWNTNIPNAALPYEDTLYLDNCSDGHLSVGFGVGDVSQLVQGTRYWVETSTYGEPGANASFNGTVKLLAQTGTNYDASDPTGGAHLVSQLDRDCTFDSTEISQWNQADFTGSAHRDQESWCSWIDYTHRYEEPGAFTLTTNNQIAGPWATSSNYLGAIGRMETSAWNGIAGQNRWQTCNNGSVTAYQQSCVTRFDASTSGVPAFLWWHIPKNSSANANFTGEAEVRCPPRADSNTCTVGVMVSGTNGINDVGAEYKYVWTTIPDDNQYYHCRVDSKHLDAAAHDAWSSSHTYLEVGITGDAVAGHSLDVDNVYMGGWSKQEHPATAYSLPVYGAVTIAGVGSVATTDACTLGTN